MTSQRATTRPFTGYHVLAALVAFFLVIFAVNGVMIYKAETTFGGLDTQDAYRKGLTYNDRIAAAEEQARLGWQDRTDFIAETRSIRVALTDRAGEAVPGLNVSAKLQRPTTSQFDHEISLSPTGANTYEASVADLEPGWWTVNIRAQRGSEGEALYEARRRLWIKP